MASADLQRRDMFPPAGWPLGSPEGSGTSVSGAYLLAPARPGTRTAAGAVPGGSPTRLNPPLGLVDRRQTRLLGLGRRRVLPLSRWFDALDFTRHDGSIAQVYLMLIASTPLTGRMLLWVLAPAVVRSQEIATT